MKTPDTRRHASSFRDPAGFVFMHRDLLYRQVNLVAQDDFDHFIDSGLYKNLVESKLLVEHRQIEKLAAFEADAKRYKIIKPALVPFISYPYEWSFHQLKDAALLTLRVQQMALKHGMILKDASAYNVQFIGRQPIFIDSLSFWKYSEGDPWEGYKQFCQHFVAPLALSAYGSPEIIKSLRVFLDGLPLELSVKLLPVRACLSRGLLSHIYLHAASAKRYAQPQTSKSSKRRVSPLALRGLLASLEATIKRLNLPRRQTQWGDYYSDTNYSSKAFRSKKQIVASMIKQVSPAPKVVWDLGANDGSFSQLAASAGAYCLAFDSDALAVEQNYQKNDDYNNQILPLVQDLANPSPPLGWAHSERLSLVQRGPADLAIALALVHHLAITEHSPLPSIAEFLASVCRSLIVEFVPKTDSKVQALLSAFSRNIFTDYDEKHFQQAFEAYFTQLERRPISDSQRVIYLYKVKV